MKKKRIPPLHLHSYRRPWAVGLVMAGSLLAGAAQAAGWGPAAPSVGLGQPLDFAVSWRMDAGEAALPECLSAQVMLGERQLPASDLSLRVDDSASGAVQVRVRTRSRVDEPVVTVLLSAGCQAPVSRRFVVFADPPELNVASAAPAVSPMLATVAAMPTAATLQGAGARGQVAALPVRAQGVPVDGGLYASTVSAAVQAADAPAAPPAAPPLSRPKPNTPATRAGASPPAAKANPPRPEAPRRAAGPRLRLDAAPALAAEPTPTLDQQLIDVVDQANEAVKAAIAAASASQGRIAALEQGVQRMQAEAAAQRAQMQALRERAEAAEAHTGWTWPLMLAALVLLMLSAALAWRLRRLEQERSLAWRDAARRPVAGATRAAGRSTRSMQPKRSGHGAADADGDDKPSGFAGLTQGPAGSSTKPPSEPPPGPPRHMDRAATSEPPTLPGAVTAGTSAPGLPVLREAPRARRHGGPGAGLAPAHADPVSGWPELSPPAPLSAPPPAPGATRPRAPRPEAAEPSTQRTQALVSDDTRSGDERDVSAEELIDLEQQAEFFVVLGQDDAAVDLLVEHLRDTGGASPLPYLKLLEIYRRSGDEAAYERTRDRFNHRFNAHAPTWAERARDERSLADYPQVMGWLEHVWPTPLDAMAELEALLFRRDGGDLFELPAYRELLFLYGMARDLLDHDGKARLAAVDVLLPLGDGGSVFDTTAPQPMFHGADEGHYRDAGPTAPLGLGPEADPTGSRGPGR